MISKQELQLISLDFRRKSSDLLMTKEENARAVLTRFYKYINDTNWIWELLNPIIKESDYDYRQCFMSDKYRHEFRIPVNETDHIKAQYDYMRYIIESNINIISLAMPHCINGETYYDDMVRNFFSDAFKPLINFINNSITKEMIRIDGDKIQAPFVNIENNYGTANIQGTGTINSSNSVNIISDEIKQLIEKILPSLQCMNNVPPADKMNVQDDLESIQEQLTSSTPKKTRIQKALNGIKEFARQFPASLAVNMATTAIVNTDWFTLIQQIELFIATL